MKTKRIEEQLADMGAKREHAQQIGRRSPCQSLKMIGTDQG